MTKSKLALLALAAGTAGVFAALSTAPVQAQNICLNAPAVSLTDTSTDFDEQQQRIDALGNRCYRSKLTGERIGRNEVFRLIQGDYEREDLPDVGTPLVELDN